MFKFGFNETQSDPNSLTTVTNTDKTISTLLHPQCIPFSLQTPLSELQHDLVPIYDSELLLRKSTAPAPSYLSPDGADIIPTKYEGGYKLWECAIDLSEFLIHSHKDSLSGKSVLELGAGHAFPAIVAAKNGAMPVHIQDYNVEVLKDVSMPNMAANVSEYEHVVSFFSGSWNGLSGVLGRLYDFVLSADTVYATEQVNELADCVLDVLSPGGSAYIAGKAYYFGVGGGTRDFEVRVKAVAKQRHINIDVRIAKEIRDGLSNVREILHLKRW